jgi:gliding motility-associated-like protein
MSVRIDPLSELIIPNVFTPNGDGINDLFTLKSKALRFVRAELYNNWGLKLYEWGTVHGGWDGRTETGVEVPQGTYYYIIIAQGVDGKEYKLNGPFTLFR